MENWIMGVLGLTAFYFCLRYFSMKRAVREADRDLKEITLGLEQNRTVKLAEPERELEELLGTINRALDEIRQERIRYEKRERNLQKQIENISHDLRTPLTSILGYLELLDREGISGEDLESLEVIQRKAKALQHLTEQFYNLSRITAEDYQSHIEELDMGRVLRECLIGHFRYLETLGLRVEAEIPEGPLTVRADRSGLERIFSNLLQNVGRYAEEVFKIAVRIEEKRIMVLFANDAPGMSKEEAGRLFERFYTGDSARSGDGTGLGLTIAKHLAESMGGTLEAAAEQREEKNWLILKFVLGT